MHREHQRCAKAKKSKAKKSERMAEGAEDRGEEESVVVVRRPKMKATKQDVEMAKVSEGESFDFESIKEEDSEMVDMTLGVDAEVGTSSRPDKGKVQATPAIVIERPTPTPPVQPKLSLAMDEMPTVPDVGQSSDASDIFMN
ncbi:uncharacterized protein LACBIDRAFT_331900 [Laccaria bicolor S238N-H82]|uniref:Predicted protein n=1 Tax=Laccaria bicolor (strain S238N-H82 / ATCC MYA-4686) TaxID=486041 RepID=B0DQZ2_LACBS|nr:uncharacterized protein LACBIDRAFT_331900 [Laccaria bicolor S238N-H82]EDR02973.1 predicted protein [Laccaria bicolor S238N-H82]|eukprot:XP_001886396.1 predicted protein [Laccaria bicolor S238N-H82]